MSADLLSDVFVQFCESRTHLDSLLSQVPQAQKSKVARLFGAFLRRPLTIAKKFEIALALNRDEFWNQSFLKLKKSKPIHELLAVLWKNPAFVPSDGGVEDFPSLLFEGFEKDWGSARATEMSRLLSQDPLTTIRLHRRAFESDGHIKTDFEKWLKSEGFPKFRRGRVSPEALIFKGFARVQRNDFFKDGFFEIQDEGSQVMSHYALDPKSVIAYLSDTPQVQKVSEALATDFSQESSLMSSLVPSLTVVDACSGAGGKTLALADFMKGKGRIFAYDIYEHKIRALKERMERAGERNVKGICLVANENESHLRFKDTADIVLVDAPCRGLGVLRRNPDIKWNRMPLPVKEEAVKLPIEELQRRIISSYVPLVKRGGRLVYGVCTFAKSESLDQVQWFLNAHPDFELESNGFTGPFDTDGFFMASFQRKSP